MVWMDHSPFLWLVYPADAAPVQGRDDAETGIPVITQERTRVMHSAIDDIPVLEHLAKQLSPTG